MARQARKVSNSGIYHVIIRGIDKRNLFLEDLDYMKFLSYLLKSKEKNKGEIYSYCLMTNRAHFLVKTEEVTIGNFMRSIVVGYVQYHNNKYGRTGHLFQNRFLSEPVEDNNYLMTVQRYIHQNPFKVGIVENIKDYKWSSYNEYLNKKPEICDIDFLLEIFSSVKQFIDFTETENEDKVLDYSIKRKYTDDELRNKITEKFNISEVLESSIKDRNRMLKEILELTKVSKRQLGRVLGIGRGIMERIK